MCGCGRVWRLEAERGLDADAGARLLVTALRRDVERTLAALDAQLTANAHARRELVEGADRSLVAAAAFRQTLDTLRFANIDRDAPALIQRPGWRWQTIILRLAGDRLGDAARCGEALVPRYRIARLDGRAWGCDAGCRAVLRVRDASRRQNGGSRDHP